jgi:hypothetical protein
MVSRSLWTTAVTFVPLLCLALVAPAAARLPPDHARPGRALLQSEWPSAALLCQQMAHPPACRAHLSQCSSACGIHPWIYDCPGLAAPAPTKLYNCQ